MTTRAVSGVYPIHMARQTGSAALTTYVVFLRYRLQAPCALRGVWFIGVGPHRANPGIEAAARLLDLRIRQRAALLLGLALLQLRLNLGPQLRNILLAQLLALPAQRGLVATGAARALQLRAQLGGLLFEFAQEAVLGVFVDLWLVLDVLGAIGVAQR